MGNFKVFYDETEDVLYLAKEGKEEEVVELAPGVKMKRPEKVPPPEIELMHVAK